MERRKLRRVVLISAVSTEGKSIRDNLGQGEIGSSGLPESFAGRLCGMPVVYAVSGMGKTNAAHAATALIGKFRPSLVINFGVGGAYPSSGLAAGDIAVATKEIYADEGVLMKDGLHTFEVTGVPLLTQGRRRYFNVFPLDSRLGRAAVNSAKRVAKSRAGAFATVSACTGTRKRAAEIERRFNAVCENMEGAAVAHICRIYGVSFVEIRGISNIVEDRDLSKWDIKRAADTCQNAVESFLAYLSGRDLSSGTS